MNTTPISVEDVLEAFALEPQVDRPTLDRYLREFPQFTGELIDLSREIFLFSHEEEGPLLDSDRMRVNSALSQFESAATRAAQPVLARLSPERQRALANVLGVPRQVILCFMERAVIAKSVPMRFLSRMANELQSNAQELLAYLSQPRQAMARSAKAVEKPGSDEKVAFEQLLREAGVSEVETSQLLAEDP